MNDNIQKAQDSFWEAAELCETALCQTEKERGGQRGEVLKLRLRSNLGSARCLALNGEGANALKAVDAALHRYGTSAGRERLGPAIDVELVLVRAEAHLALEQSRDAVKWCKFANLLLSRVGSADVAPLQAQIDALQRKLRRHLEMGMSPPGFDSSSSVVESTPGSMREWWRRRLMTVIPFTFVVANVTIIINISLNHDPSDDLDTPLVNRSILVETVLLFLFGWLLHARKMRRRMFGEGGFILSCAPCERFFRRPSVLLVLDWVYVIICLFDSMLWVFIGWRSKAFVFRKRVGDDTAVLLVRDVGCILNSLGTPTRLVMAFKTASFARQASQNPREVRGRVDSDHSQIPVCLLDTVSGDQSEEMNQFVDEFNVRIEENAFYTSFSQWWSSGSSNKTNLRSDKPGSNMSARSAGEIPLAPIQR